MGQPRGGQGLALGARALPALERDLLDRDGPVEALVVGQPDRPEPARAEAPEQPVAVEDELTLGLDLHGLGGVHRLRGFVGYVLSACQDGKGTVPDGKLALRMAFFDEGR